jgi:hypothetical protein
VVGAPVKSSTAGAAYVFVRSGSTWSQQAELSAADAARGDGFGCPVAIYGSTVVIGAAGTNGGRAGVRVRGVRADNCEPGPQPLIGTDNEQHHWPKGSRNSVQQDAVALWDAIQEARADA